MRENGSADVLQSTPAIVHPLHMCPFGDTCYQLLGLMKAPFPFPYSIQELRNVLRSHLADPQCPSISPKEGKNVWEIVDSELKPLHDFHHEFWWIHGGIALASLLHYAGYSPGLQYLYLRFFADLVAPSLGVARSCHASHCLSPYSSFMTDDGTPIELSWDWGYGNTSSAPIIRYSIEPVGLNAGTLLDRDNSKEAVLFQNRLISSTSNINLTWFTHFHEYFLQNVQDSPNKQGHSSRIFYAFDLCQTGITSKVYFFPRYIADLKRVPVMDIIWEAITSAPQGAGLQKALRAFSEYTLNQHYPPEIEMLSIDMIEPAESRVKLYFRSRQTDFESVRTAMSLDGRLASPQIERGLEELKDLWKALFNADTDDNVSLHNVNHRTAGILYNVEFRVNEGHPAIKVYLPVRHYGESDRSILRGLCEFMARKNRDQHTLGFLKMMESIL